MKELSFFILLLTGIYGKVWCHNTNDIDFVYRLTKTTENVNIDGSGDDKAWQQAEEISKFVLNAPIDNAPPDKNTRVRLLCDDDNLCPGRLL